MKTLLMIASSQNPDLLRTPRALGLRLLLAAGKAPEDTDLYDEHLPVNEFDEEAVLAAVRAHLAAGGAVDAVACFHEGCLHVAAAVAEELGLPGNPVQAVWNMRDKYRCAGVLRDAGVPSPETRLVTDPRSASEAAEQIGFPLVVKPQSSAMSQGVVKVNDLSELDQAISLIDTVYTSDGFSDGRYRVDNIGKIYIHPRLRGIVLQEYLPGPEIAVDVVYGDGVYRPLVIHDKPLPFVHHFIEGAYVTPSELDADVQARVLDVTVRALRALGATAGGAHVELRVTPDGPKILEVNGRLGGTTAFVQESIHASVGVWGPREYLRAVLGERPDGPTHDPRPAGFTALLAPRTGEIAAFHGAQEVLQIPGIQAVRWMNKPGDHVVIDYPANPVSCFALVLATGQTRADVLAALVEADRTLRPVYADELVKEPAQ